ncbi:alpha/beta fold hydrolase [Vibrio sonorensis]|uniref:alpha/beta fold hydrolase n=1 Tax=Vibrio sonorensis TaxID=1004316 RepID=UPI0008D90CEE|nr:alpha/beta hydrolase [Vibrio sonorensis]
MIEKRYVLSFGELATIETNNKNTADISVVFIHGWLDNAASFSALMSQMADKAPHLHLCAIDLPGHGHSDHKSADNFYPFHDYIDDIYQFLTILSPNRLVFVGHSLGALISSCYSAAFPEQVAALIQIEGFGPLAESEDKTVERLLNGIKSRQRIRKKPSRYFSSIEGAIQKRARTNLVSCDAIRPIVQRGTKQIDNGQWCWRHDRKLLADSLYRMSFAHAEALVERVTCPQLVILGKTGYEALKGTPKKSNKSLQFVEVEGAHHCHLEEQIRVNDLILGLVNKI